MKSLTRRERYLILALAVAALLLLYTKMFLLPILEKIDISNQTVQDYKLQVIELTAMKTVNENMRKSLTELKTKYQDALIQLPEQPRNPEVAYNLKPLADLCSVKLDSVSLGSGEQYSAPAQPEAAAESAGQPEEGQESQEAELSSISIFSMPVTIAATAGSYSDVMKFIGLLENDKRFTGIKTISLSGRGESSSAGNGMTLTVSVNYYYTTGSKEKPTYYFNNGSYGKDDLFR
jgi:Tfp pilus assembly protein PilO